MNRLWGRYSDHGRRGRDKQAGRDSRGVLGSCYAQAVFATGPLREGGADWPDTARGQQRQVWARGVGVCVWLEEEEEERGMCLNCGETEIRGDNW